MKLWRKAVAVNRPALLALSLVFGCLQLGAGCSTTPSDLILRRYFEVTVRLDEDGAQRVAAPTETEVWFDDGYEIVVKRVGGDGVAVRGDDGQWTTHLPSKPHDGKPWDVPWYKYYDPGTELPARLRILVIRNGRPVAFVSRPLTPLSRVLEDNAESIEAITVRSARDTPSVR